MARTKPTARRAFGFRTPSPDFPGKVPAVSLETLAPIPRPEYIPPPQRRSIRAASVAIVKREQEIKRLNEDTSPVSSPIPTKEKKATSKKKRKLNTKKVVMVPNSTSSTDDLSLEDTPVDNYAKYLSPKEGHVAPIVINVKKRKIIKRDIEKKGPSATITSTNDQIQPLDFSQHSIIPNASYIAHISSKQKSSITNNSKEDLEESNEQFIRSESEDEFFDALSEFEDGHEAMQDVM